MAKKDQPGITRKMVFVPSALWQRVKVEAVERDLDISDVITEMLSERYAADPHKEKGAATSKDPRPNRQSPAFAAV